MKVIVFDLGGTLMQYTGMPHSWVDFYVQGFEKIDEIYPDTVPVLQKLKEEGYYIATHTDLPSGFPDSIFLRDIAALMEYFDYYVSSAVSGYRKPNCRGLQMISEKYELPMEELVLVGDEEKDRQTAERAGCRFVWIDRSGNGEGNIRRLEELLEKEL